MASTGQIIPKYQFPHQMLIINDNTIRSVDVEQKSFDLKSVNVFVSGKGKDNVFIEKTSYTDFINEYGRPSMEYGQASYMPYVSLRAGYNSCHCMRVMPDDAKYANAVLVAEVRYGDKPVKVMIENPAYSPDPNVNPKQLKNPAFQEMYIPNPYKDMTTDQLVTAIGHDAQMPNINFDPSQPVSLTNPLTVTNIYKIVDAGTFSALNQADIVYDGGDGKQKPDVVLDALAFGEERNIFYGIPYIVNSKYNADVPEFIENPDYEQELIQAVFPRDNKVHVSMSVQSVDMSDLESLDALISAIETQGQTPNEEGYVRIPLMAFYSCGRGIYGNNYVISLGTDVQGDKSNEFKNYAVRITNTDGSSNELFARMSLFPQAITRNSSLYMPDVINDENRGSQNVNCYVYDAGIEALAKFIEDKTKVPVDRASFNVLFGKTKENKDMPNVSYERIKPSHIDLVNNSFNMNGGDDGAIAEGKPNRQKVINDLYIKAFSGMIDRSILSKKRIPANYLFDANYAKEVKDAMKDLCDRLRNDIQGYFDGGIINTATELQAWVADQTDNSRMHSVDPFNFKTKDPFTGKVITVTATYFLAANLAKHVATNGLNVPFAQARYAKLTGIVKGSLKPAIDSIDSDIKQLLYTNGINYYESIGENEFMRSTQLTSQKTTSDLSLESNMRVLLTIARRLEKLNDNFIYNFAEEEDRKLYTDAADRVLNEYQTMFKEAKVKFEMTPYEERYNILHCYLSIKFETVIERIITEIDINPRV